MTTLTPILPFALNYNEPCSYNMERIFPKVHYNRLQRHLQNNPIDMHTMGLLSSLVPNLRHWNVHGVEKIKEDFGHVTSDKGAVIDRDHDFHVHLDVSVFAPKELEVRIADDFLIIEGKHEEREAEDIGFVARHFSRRYMLPKDYNPDAIVSELSSDGVLSVMLPKANVEHKERIVSIQHPGPNDLFLKKYKSDHVMLGEEKAKK